MKKIDVTLLLLYADGQRPIDGITRFEKLVFLVQEEIIKKRAQILTSGSFEFEPDRFGPLAVELYDQLSYLRSSNMITTENEQNYALTSTGNDFVEKIVLPRTPKAIVDAIEKLKSKFGRTDLTTLLKYVYSTYPDFTIKSEIRDKILRH
jgi:uncharacterized protein YwgA